MATTAVFIAIGGTTYAATGGNFILGQTNTASSTTALSAGTTGPALKATNTSTGTAASFNVASGHPPFSVNSGTKVTNLNADKLDGLDSTSFLSGSKLRRVGPVTLQPPDSTDNATLIATVGHFTFIGGCRTVIGGSDLIYSAVSSDVDHSAYASITQSEAGATYGSGDMTGGTNNFHSLANIDNLAHGTPNVNPMSGSAVGPDGQEVFFNSYQAINSRNQPGQCIWGGSFAVK
jgi:hypothetical protein